MSRIPLPIEICQYIVQYAEYSDLPALALVNRATQESSESHLYHSLSIAHSPFALQLFTTIIQSGRLGPLVKILHLFRENVRGAHPGVVAQNDRLIMSDQYWMLVRDVLRAMSGLKMLTLVDPTLTHSWVLDPTDVDVEMVQRDEDAGDIGGGDIGDEMREVVRDKFFDFKLRELRLFTQWTEPTSAFVLRQDQLRRLQITPSRGVTHGMVLPQPLPNAETQTLQSLSVYEGPLGIVPNLYGCPTVQMKITLELLEHDDIEEHELRETYRSLRNLDNFKNLRVLAIVGIPFDGYDTPVRYEQRSSRALNHARKISGYSDASEDDVAMDSGEDNTWVPCVECIRAVAIACPNLEYLAYIPLIVDQKGRIALFKALHSMHRLLTVELDVSHWLPQPSGTYQRMLVLEMRIFVPSIERVFIFANGERTSWTRERHMQPRTIITPSPMKIIIPPKSVRDATNRSNSERKEAVSGSNGGSTAGGALHTMGEDAGALPSRAEPGKTEEIVVDEVEDVDMLGSVDQWRGRYVHSHHPAESLLWRHF